MRLGITAMKTNQHELSVIPEVQTPVDRSRFTGRLSCVKMEKCVVFISLNNVMFEFLLHFFQAWRILRKLLIGICKMNQVYLWPVTGHYTHPLCPAEINRLLKNHQAPAPPATWSGERDCWRVHGHLQSLQSLVCKFIREIIKIQCIVWLNVFFFKDSLRKKISSTSSDSSGPDVSGPSITKCRSPQEVTGSTEHVCHTLACSVLGIICDLCSFVLAAVTVTKVKQFNYQC